MQLPGFFPWRPQTCLGLETGRKPCLFHQPSTEQIPWTAQEGVPDHGRALNRMVCKVLSNTDHFRSFRWIWATSQLTAPSQASSSGLSFPDIAGEGSNGSSPQTHPLPMAQNHRVTQGVDSLSWLFSIIQHFRDSRVGQPGSIPGSKYWHKAAAVLEGGNLRGFSALSWEFSAGQWLWVYLLLWINPQQSLPSAAGASLHRKKLCPLQRVFSRVSAWFPRMDGKLLLTGWISGELQ